MISIVIPSSGGADGVLALCRSIQRQNIKEPPEVIVVANPPNIELEAVLKSFGENYKYFANTQCGVNRARNKGITESHGDVIFFFDDDCELPRENYLTQCCEYLNQHTDVSGIGGGYRSKEKFMSKPGQAYYFIQNRWLHEGLDQSGNNRYLIGGNMILRRRLFLKYGKFDEELSFGGAESEFFRRMTGETFRLISHLSVLHSYDISGWKLLKKAFMQGRGRAYSESLHGTNVNNTVKWGAEALLKELNLDAYPRYWIHRYDIAFQEGERFFVSHKFLRPSSWRIFCALVPAMLKFSKRSQWQGKIDRLISIVENYRGRQ